MSLSSLQIEFNAFMIVTGTTGLNSQTYTAYIEVCSGTACTAYVSIRYCRFRNFLENFVFANAIIRHISDVKNSRLRQGLPLSINDRVILPFREGFIFTNMRSFVKIKSLQKFRIYSIKRIKGAQV